MGTQIRKLIGEHKIPISLIAVVCTFVISFVLCSIPAIAHPPAEVVLSYDLESQILTVSVTHTSKSPGEHYVKKVEIKKNGKSVGVYEYNDQPNTATFVYTYKISAQRGDVLEAVVSCNKYGSKTGKLTVGKELT
jgi:desulfoferrodoxin (superoxide reductase-like protein)